MADSIPPEVWENVFRNLSAFDLASIRATSHRMHEMVNEFHPAMKFITSSDAHEAAIQGLQHNLAMPQLTPLLDYVTEQSENVAELLETIVAQRRRVPERHVTNILSRLWDGCDGHHARYIDECVYVGPVTVVRLARYGTSLQLQEILRYVFFHVTNNGSDWWREWTWGYWNECARGDIIETLGEKRRWDDIEYLQFCEEQEWAARDTRKYDRLSDLCMYVVFDETLSTDPGFKRLVQSYFPNLDEDEFPDSVESVISEIGRNFHCESTILNIVRRALLDDA